MTSPDVPPKQLPILEPGVRLYELTLAWIEQTWGGCNTMPPRGLQLWNLVLRLSRRRSAPGDSLKQWAVWLAENFVAEPPPTTVNATHSPRAPGSRKGKRINEWMKEMLEKDATRLNWSAQDWAEKLGCSKSTVAGTPTWRMILDTRTLREAERARSKNYEPTHRGRFRKKRPKDG
jgi:hypothetical protein